jgi:hypothetical protein
MLNSPLTKPVSHSPVSIHWKGLSQLYVFQLDPLRASYRPIPGVYIFCRDLGGGSFSALYVGETSSFQRRLTDELQGHHSLEAVLRLGATHISTLHVPGDLSQRLRIETDLRNSLKPPCNRQ